MSEEPWRRKDALRQATGFSLSKIDRWVREGKIEKRDLPDEYGHVHPHFRLAHHVDAPPGGAALASALRDALQRLSAVEEDNRHLHARIAALEGAREALALPAGDAPRDASEVDAASGDASPDASPRRWWRQWAWRRP